MTTSRNSPAQIFPGRGVGFLTLGASLHHVLTRLKALPQCYHTINLSCSLTNPVNEPILVILPGNGLRLRFDGPDQRLRLIEILDFNLIPLVYKSQEVVKTSRSLDAPPPPGPNFRHVYNRLFGPSYPGEYIPPKSNESHGTYVLSYPGVAFSFPLLHSAWSGKCDFVSLMSSKAASPATSMSVFQGTSWADGRANIFTRQPQYPRSTVLAGKNKESVADEIDLVKIHKENEIELVRRSTAPFWIILSETTPQDLVAELGPPDAIYRKSDRRIMIHGARAQGFTNYDGVNASPSRGAHQPGMDHPSENGITDDSDESQSPTSGYDPVALTSECFYNYFHHGFDVLISRASTPGRSNTGSPARGASLAGGPPQLTATKVLLHGNVPGSYPFNRHRRCRWVLDIESGESPVTSETPYEQISQRLKAAKRDSSPSVVPEDASLQRGMVLNRGWGDTPSSSIELLGNWEDSPGSKQWSNTATDNAQTLGNTELFGFSGLLFEVLKNDTVSCLTIY